GRKAARTVPGYLERRIRPKRKTSSASGWPIEVRQQTEAAGVENNDRSGRHAAARRFETVEEPGGHKPRISSSAEKGPGEGFFRTFRLLFLAAIPLFNPGGAWSLRRSCPSGPLD